MGKFKDYSFLDEAHKKLDSEKFICGWVSIKPITIPFNCEFYLELGYCGNKRYCSQKCRVKEDIGL
jgi:hypothetical protein